MAETFSSALKRYHGAGYAAGDAMRAAWHDVKIGRVERPRRKGVVARAKAAKYPVLGQGLQARRSNPIDVEWTSPDQWTGQPRARRARWSTRVTGRRITSARKFIADKIRAGETPARMVVTGARRSNPSLPKRGDCIQLPDRRLLCHDSLGYYIVDARKKNPLVPGPQLTAEQARQVLAAYVHRHTAIGPSRYYRDDPDWLATHSFHFTKGGRLHGGRRYAEPYYGSKTLAQIGAEHRARTRRARGNPHAELTGEQHQVLNAWARYGPAHWLRKVKGGWIDELPAIVGHFPTVWKTKREAMERVDNLILLQAKRWRGIDPYAENPYLATIFRKGVPSPAIGLTSATAAARFQRKHERRGYAVAVHPVSRASYRGWAKARRTVEGHLRGNPMSKKDFIAIAEELHGLALSKGTTAALDAAHALLPALQASNARFDKQRFLDYVVSGGGRRRRNPTIVPGQKVRTWGGWYRHDRVMEQGKDIGRIQVRVRPGSKGRRDYLTLEPAGAAPGAGGAVLGSDVGWLVRRARERGEINPGRRPQGGVYAYVQDRGRAWIESIDTIKGTARVRFDPGEGMRSKQHTVPLRAIDFSHEWRPSMTRSNPPRFKVGDRAAIADPVRVTSRFWSAQHQGIIGAGGMILPRSVLDKPGTIATVGPGGRSLGPGVKRVLLDWGMDDENRSLGIWLDSDQLVRANPQGLASRTVDMLERGRPVVRHVFYGSTPAVAASIERAHVGADRSLAAAMAGRPYRGVAIGLRRVGQRSSPRGNPPAQLTKFYDGITEIRGVKGRRFGFRPGTRFKHPFTSRPRAYGVDHGGSARLRRGDVVLRGRRSIYAQLG